MSPCFVKTRDGEAMSPCFVKTRDGEAMSLCFIKMQDEEIIFISMQNYYCLKLAQAKTLAESTVSEVRSHVMTSWKKNGVSRRPENIGPAFSIKTIDVQSRQSVLVCRLCWRFCTTVVDCSGHLCSYGIALRDGGLTTISIDSLLVSYYAVYVDCITK